MSWGFQTATTIAASNVSFIRLNAELGLRNLADMFAENLLVRADAFAPTGALY
jgi:hypothetical protein